MELFDRTEQTRTEAGERAILVHLELPDAMGREDLDEFHHLVTSSGVQPIVELTGKRDRPDPALFIGTGKADELAAMVSEYKADVVLFNHALSPGQERNLERVVKCRVLDRTGLILDIFAQRARTHEGRLQVELAQLRHLSSRLVRGWTHLERQKGGIGLRGPGETQLETDRRLLRDRIRGIESRLDKVRKQRAQGRRARQRSETPLISLVGYTNAGKSTLFNAITTGDVYVADQLFATLDRSRRHHPAGLAQGEGAGRRPRHSGRHRGLYSSPATPVGAGISGDSGRNRQRHPAAACDRLQRGRAGQQCGRG